MKLEIICPECGYGQVIEVEEGDLWNARCSNCECPHIVMRLMSQSQSQSQSSSTSVENILTEASAIINGERLNTYGKPEDSFQIIAGFWKVYLEARSKLPDSLNALDVAHMMTLFKLARLLGQISNRDNYRDACGYLAIAADRLSSDRSS